VDAVEWVELPNTLGMSQYADGGIMASKPYVATGKYIQRMSNHCGNCRYKPDASTGETACPFTTLYWEFLDRHQELLAKNPRMSLQVKNLSRLTNDQRKEISQQARRIRLKLASETL
jgi:deoxyribodipyrimidine photolyase-related protein